MKLGILGVGRIGAMHAGNAAASAAVEEVVLHDADAPRATALARDLSGGEGPRAGGGGGGRGGRAAVRAVADVEELFAAVDGVLVATPSATHPAVVTAALGAGVPVLCEKPLALDPEEVVILADLADAAQVPLVVGFQRRFDPALTAMRAAIASGEYGRVYLVRALAMDHRPPSMDYIATSGGIFVDQLVHDLDALPWLLGEPVVSVHATGAVLVDPAFADADDVDTTVVTLTFASGALGVVVGGRSNGGGYDNRLEISAELASVTAGLDAATPLTSLEPGVAAPVDPYPSFTDRWARAYAAELEAFAAIAAHGAPNPSPARESLHALAVARACGRSLREGRPVPVDAAGADAPLATTPLAGTPLAEAAGVSA